MPMIGFLLIYALGGDGMKLRAMVVAVACAVSIAACGGSGSSTQTGIFSDAPTGGLTYQATPSGITGTTSSTGEFQYLSGDTVTFKIGAQVLGSVQMTNSGLAQIGGKAVVRPKDIAQTTDETDEKALAIATLIQTAAGNPGANASSIDVSGHAGQFTTTASVATLAEVDSLLRAKGLTPQSMENVTAHLLNAPAQVSSVEFTATEVADANGVVTLSDANRAIAYTTSTLKVTYRDGSTRIYPLSFNNLFNNIDTSKTADGSEAAAIRNKNGGFVMNGANHYVPEAPDANSLLNVGGNLFLVSHWEYENANYGKLPMTMTLAKLDQSSSDGKLTVKAGGISQVNFADVNGLWIPCAGSRSPWNTHLGSEEYEPDARCDAAVGDSTYAASSACTAMEYTARMNAFRVLYGETNASPYNYGRVPEVTVAADGSSSVQKWYTLGRTSREKVQFFGDSRTAIQGDDGTYTLLTMFVADAPKDLSSGSLYAAKWNQTSASNGGAATLTWIKLGASTHAQIKAAVDAGVKFSDIFDTSSTAAAGYTTIKHGHEVATTEYLKLKSGSFAGVPIATLAAFLETRRYAAMLGATVEFEKMEGVTYNAKDSKAYVAMTRMTNGMTDRAGDPGNDIKLTANNSGAVYVLNLRPSQNDSDGNGINSRFVPVDMTALVVGEDQTADVDGNTSKVEKIASPDNLSFSEHMRVLFIGEDSGRHVNNFLWAYHVDSGKLVRILSLPMGAESTGLQVVDNMNGYAYVMSNYQHAGDQNGTVAATYNRILPLINVKKAEVGYLGGLPSMR